MSGTADISSSFVISVAQDSAAAETLAVTNPGRSFTINQIEICWIGLEANISDSKVQIKRAAADGTTVDLFTVAAGVDGSRTTVPVWLGDTAPQNVTTVRPQQNNSFSNTQNLRLTVAGASTQVAVKFYCLGNPAQSLTVTVI